MRNTKPSILSSVIEFLKLIRITNLAIVATSQYLIWRYQITSDTSFHFFLFESNVALLLLGTVIIAASGYIINDYYDVKIDVVNKPERVVIDRTLKRRKAFILQWVLNSVAVTIGFYLGPQILVVFVITIFLLWLYSNQLKRLPLVGNVTVSITTAFSILILNLHAQTPSFTVYVFALFAFFISLIREIIKDIEDKEGDEQHGCYTLPIVWGVRRTKIFLTLLIVSFSGLVILITNSYTPKLYLPAIFGLTPLLLALIILLLRADKKRHFDLLSSFCKIIMLIGMTGIIFA